jgi:hypothetical protein
MFDFWDRELEAQEEEELIERLAADICRRGLDSPALLFFESHKPLSFLGSQAAVVASPFLVPFLGFDRVNDYTRLFSKRENVDRLIERIAERSDGKRSDREEPAPGANPSEEECE